MSDRIRTLIDEAKKVGFNYHSIAYAPGFYGTTSWDGGQLCISKFPIVKSEFRPFQTPAVVEDALALKGCLYTKIEISPESKTSLHITNVHTQASYFDDKLKYYVDSYVCRYKQVKETRDFVYSKVLDDPANYTKDKDLVMILGDFNMNGAGLTKASMQKLEEASKDTIFKPVLPLLRNEYKSLIKAL